MSSPALSDAPSPPLKRSFAERYRAMRSRWNSEWWSVMLGGPINFLNEYEQLKAQNVDRPWATWKKQVGAP